MLTYTQLLIFDILGIDDKIIVFSQVSF